MSQPAHQSSLLPKEQLDALISQVDLLMAMYPSDNDMAADEQTSRSLDVLREWCASENNEQISETFPNILTFEVVVPIEASSGTVHEENQQVQFSVDVPVRHEATVNGSKAEIAPSLKVRLRQPQWMNRTQTSTINGQIPSDYADDAFAIIEYLRDEAAKYLTLSPTSSTTLPSGLAASRFAYDLSQPLIRVWFYFPSLSTRAKRADLVSYAPTYDLTGFVLAGKPGILCLEGTSRNVDEYMKYIKTESWGDIPSHQKKVSERYREVLGPGEKVFQDMQEITDADWMGEKRGERGNRSDLRALEGWLEGLGLKGVFERVLIN